MKDDIYTGKVMKKRAGRVKVAQLNLDRSAQIALEKAFEHFKKSPLAGVSRPEFFGWLLERAAEAYATTDRNTLDHVWEFDARIQTIEERAADDLLFSLTQRDQIEEA